MNKLRKVFENKGNYCRDFCPSDGIHLPEKQYHLWHQLHSCKRWATSRSVHPDLILVDESQQKKNKKKILLFKYLSYCLNIKDEVFLLIVKSVLYRLEICLQSLTIGSLPVSVRYHFPASAWWQLSCCEMTSVIKTLVPDTVCILLNGCSGCRVEQNHWLFL